jgi:hypothetical protein
VSDPGSVAVRLAPWWGLVVVPSVFLGGLSLAYAVVSLACRSGSHALVHLAPAGEVLVAIIGIALSTWSVLRLRQAAGDAALRSRRFVATVSLVTAGAFLGASIVQWYVAAAMSPCI